MNILRYQSPAKDMRCPICKSYKTVVVVDTNGYYAQCKVCSAKSIMFDAFDEAANIWRVKNG